MFKIQPNPTFNLTVKVPTPGEAPQSLKLLCHYKDEEQAREFLARAIEAEGQGERADLTEIVAGWEDVDEEFSPEALKRLLRNYGGAGRAIFQAYLDELQGQRRGN
ncbi:phage tail assembly chaperone [Cupriavidus respiraculi]|uniref:Phage protein n=1 Tax=Cupriavidus respiraculi TaxID=195930 RepID=A0ABM8XV66_9BURK|nr:phage tail assembly chaperone [Cupriavidus respiraculi]CAG9184285.1 hypothetical protein LMG21510_05059 [Cupriavidus respiraculi]